jgi:hypothetical protein
MRTGLLLAEYAEDEARSAGRYCILPHSSIIGERPAGSVLSGIFH